MMGVYTKEYGKIRAVARSARKAKGKLKGHLELFLDTELMLAQGKNIDTIASSLAVESFSGIKSDLKLLSAAYLIIELADKFTDEEHRDERIFWLLEKSLVFLNDLAEKHTPNPSLEGNSVGTGFKPVPTTVLLFQIHLLNLAGFSPELNKCVICGKPIKPNKNYFSVLRGGIIGEECFAEDRSARPISVEMIKLLRLFQLGKEDFDVGKYKNKISRHLQTAGKLKIAGELVEGCIFLMNDFMEFSAERKVKGIEFFKKIGIIEKR